MRFFPLIRSKIASVVFTLLLCLPFWFFSSMAELSKPLSSLSLPVMLFSYVPILLMVTGLWAGLLPFLFSLVCIIFMMGASFGSIGLISTALFLVPLSIVFLFVVEKEKPFWNACLSIFLAFLAGQIAIYLLLSNLAGGDIPMAAGKVIASQIDASPFRDLILLSFYQSGLIFVKEDLLTSVMVLKDGFASLTDFGVAEMLKSIANTIENLLSALPSLIIGGAISTSIVGFGLSLYLGRISAQKIDIKKNSTPPSSASEETPSETKNEGNVKQLRKIPENFPDLKMPDLSTWHIPKGYGLMVFSMAIGYLFLYTTNSNTLFTIGYIMTAIFTTIFSIQGMASMNFLQKKMGAKPLTRKVILVLVYTLLPPLLLWLGLLDQATNSRKLRTPTNRTDG